MKSLRSLIQEARDLLNESMTNDEKQRILSDFFGGKASRGPLLEWTDNTGLTLQQMSVYVDIGDVDEDMWDRAHNQLRLWSSEVLPMLRVPGDAVRGSILVNGTPGVYEIRLVVDGLVIPNPRYRAASPNISAQTTLEIDATDISVEGDRLNVIIVDDVLIPRSFRPLLDQTLSFSRDEANPVVQYDFRAVASSGGKKFPIGARFVRACVKEPYKHVRYSTSNIDAELLQYFDNEMSDILGRWSNSISRSNTQ